MQERRARQILQALIQGVDPFDGKELPSGTVLQQADVLRAMLAGVAAMEQDAVRASRRAQLPRNIGRSWTDDENMKLVTAFKAGESLDEIAAAHGRTLRAIEARLFFPPPDAGLSHVAPRESNTPPERGRWRAAPEGVRLNRRGVLRPFCTAPRLLKRTPPPRFARHLPVPGRRSKPHAIALPSGGGAPKGRRGRRTLRSVLYPEASFISASVSPSASLRSAPPPLGEE